MSPLLLAMNAKGHMLTIGCLLQLTIGNSDLSRATKKVLLSNFFTGGKKMTPPPFFIPMLLPCEIRVSQ